MFGIKRLYVPLSVVINSVRRYFCQYDYPYLSKIEIRHLLTIDQLMTVL